MTADAALQSLYLKGSVEALQAAADSLEANPDMSAVDLLRFTADHILLDNPGAF